MLRHSLQLKKNTTMNATEFFKLLDNPEWINYFSGACFFNGKTGVMLDVELVPTEDRANVVIEFAESVREYGLKQLVYRAGKNNDEYYDAIEALCFKEEEATNGGYSIYKSNDMYAAWWGESDMLKAIETK